MAKLKTRPEPSCENFQQAIAGHVRNGEEKSVAAIASVSVADVLDWAQGKLIPNSQPKRANVLGMLKVKGAGFL